jgi:hypothetical protein
MQNVLDLCCFATKLSKCVQTVIARNCMLEVSDASVRFLTLYRVLVCREVLQFQRSLLRA